MSLSVLPKTRAGMVPERIHKTGTGTVQRVAGLVTRTDAGLVPEVGTKTGTGMVPELFLVWYLEIGTGKVPEMVPKAPMTKLGDLIVCSKPFRRPSCPTPS